MHRDLSIFSTEIPVNDPVAMEQFQKAMNDLADATNDYILDLSKGLGISAQCAQDVWYLRTRSRWSEAAEAELIRLHSIGEPPNVFYWP